MDRNTAINNCVEAAKLVGPAIRYLEENAEDLEQKNALEDIHSALTQMAQTFDDMYGSGVVVAGGGGDK